MKKILSESEVVDLLQAAVDAVGSQNEWARDHRISQSYVSRVLRREKPPTKRILEALGLKKAERLYERIEESN